MKENLFHIILAKKYPQNRRLLPFHPLPDKERFSLGICCKLFPQPSLLRPEAVVGRQWQYAYFENMASWKCTGYVILGITIVVLIILLNFDYLPKRRLSEELELTTKSSYRESISTGRPTERTATGDTAKVRLLKLHAEFLIWYFVGLIRPKSF